MTSHTAGDCVRRGHSAAPPHSILLRLLSQARELHLAQVILVATVLAVLAAVAPRNAAAGVVVYDNFPGDYYAFDGSWQGSADIIEVMLAQRFQPNASGRLTQLTLGMTFYPLPSNVDELTLAIVDEADGVPGDVPLWRQTYLGMVTEVGWGGIARFPVTDGPVLDARTKYWLTSRSTSVGSRPHMWWAVRGWDTEPSGLLLIRGGGVFVEDEWGIRSRQEGISIPPFSLRVEVVPEPTAALLISVALLEAMVIGPKGSDPRRCHLRLRST